MVEVRTPALKERQQDLPLLASHFLEMFSRQFDKNIRALSPLAQSALLRHGWPGNVRELENAIGYACMMTLGDTVDIQDLPDYLRLEESAPRTFPSSSYASTITSGLIYAALARFDGNQSKAARVLGISRYALRQKIGRPDLSGNQVAVP
jgi:DNA-binding NtrC family response regulator